MEKISFSELKTWKECPYKHKLTYIDDNRLFKGNIYTAFGTAIHHVCEQLIVDNNVKKIETIFTEKFKEECKKVESEITEEHLSQIPAFNGQGVSICQHIIPAVKEYFSEYEVVSVEEPLFEKITEIDTDRNFKGFVDLVLKTSDGKYHIIDWKSCSWGWDSRRKADPMTTYQLTFYKKFFSDKHLIPLEDIETHFALLKRTASKSRVEIFKVSSGSKKINNAITLLETAIKNIDNKVYIKNRLSCRGCAFYKTEYCK